VTAAAIPDFVNFSFSFIQVCYFSITVLRKEKVSEVCHRIRRLRGGPPKILFARGRPMPAVVPFYSIDEEAKPLDQRVYHNHTDCPIRQVIPESRRNVGTNGYNLCPVCLKLIEINPGESVF
jgi:hypothetical protein